MEVTSATSTFSTPTAEQLGSRQETLDQLDFLQMLIAQMKTQDPLNPVDSQEYAAQLAQFTSVQELTKIKDALDQSLEMNMLMTQSINGNLAAALVGKTVRAQGNQVELSGTDGADLRFSLSSAATDVSVDVLDADGNVIRTISSSAHAAGDTAVYWDGLDANGNRAPAGTYTFAVSAANADGAAVSATPYLQGVVSAVNYADGSVSLTVNGMQVSLGDVLSVMATESSSSDSGSNTVYQG